MKKFVRALSVSAFMSNQVLQTAATKNDFSDSLVGVAMLTGLCGQAGRINREGGSFCMQPAYNNCIESCDVFDDPCLEACRSEFCSEVTFV